MKTVYAGQLWAWIAEGEGIIAAITPLGVTPMVFANSGNALMTRELASEIAQATKRKVKLVRLVEEEVVEVFG